MKVIQLAARVRMVVAVYHIEPLARQAQLSEFPSIQDHPDTDLVINLCHRQ